jgi:hypothetical protein
MDRWGLLHGTPKSSPDSWADLDLLEGEYRIESLRDGDILLHLSSEERFSTDFNGYAGLWSDAVMKSLQERILQVIKSRCESGSQP